MSSVTADVVRTKGHTIIKPIVYGNTARYFGKKREEDNHTHSWTLYVKSFYTEDNLSKYVRKVVFKLHDSYANPTRMITEPPYEVKETGWGEFEAIVKIFFIDPAERHVTFYHQLKLFNPDSQIVSGKKALVHECYDEIIFREPTVMMYKALTVQNGNKSLAKHDTDFESKKEITLKAIAEARDDVKMEIKDLKDCLKESKNLINKFRDEIVKAEQQNATSLSRPNFS